MSLKDIKIENSVKELEKIKALLELTILKNASNRESQEEIDELLLKTTLGSDQHGTQTSVADKINVIKSKLLTTSSADKVNTFAFEIKTFSLESVLEDLNKSNLKFDEYIQSFGNNNIVYISKAWEEGSIEYKRDNLNTKYVKISDTNTPRQGYTISNSFSFGIQGQVQKLISYYDNEKKIFHWENIMNEMKILAKSSGYTSNDVKIGLMGLLRLANLNQDLYEDMSIDEIANSLIKSVKPIYKTSLLWNSLRSLERQINTPLQLVLAEAESYIRKLFPDEKQKKIRENYFIIALTSFVNDSLSMEISNEIKRKKELNEYYCYDYYKESCIKLEMNESNIPTKILKYGRNLNTVQEDTLFNVSLNNINIVPVSKSEEDENQVYSFFQGAHPPNSMHRPKYYSYDKDTYENVHDTRGNRGTNERYRSFHEDTYDVDNRSRKTNRRMSPDFSTQHDISMLGANKYRTRDGHNTGHFSRDHDAEIREDYPRYRPGENCREDYNPYKYKFCRKCNLDKHYGHHEFNCEYFESFNDSNCKICHNGFHFEHNCDYKKNGGLG